MKGTPQLDLTPRQEHVLILKRSGKKTSDIASALGITTQRVYQLLARLRELGELPEEQEAS
jgi:DNA-binding CsgD family transcriptional regulator